VNRDGQKRDSNSSPKPSALFIVASLVLVISCIFLAGRYFQNPPAPPLVPVPAVVKTQIVTNSPAVVAIPTNAAPMLANDPRWVGVIAMLEAMKEWSDANPVCHLSVTTQGMGGKTYSDTDMFRFRDGDSTNFITRISVHLRYPNEVTFIIEKNNDQFIAYLPESDQLLKVDAEKEVAARFGLDLQNPDTSSFLNLLRIAFVETNANLRALTFAFKPEVLHLPAALAANDYTTLRIDDKGELQTIEQIVAGDHRVMNVRYLSFAQDVVSGGAPKIPPNKPLITGKSFDLALQEEIIAIKEMGNHLKT
jgi:hypothetical protein